MQIVKDLLSAYDNFQRNEKLNKKILISAAMQSWRLESHFRSLALRPLLSQSLPFRLCIQLCYTIQPSVGIVKISGMRDYIHHKEKAIQKTGNLSAY